MWEGIGYSTLAALTACFVVAAMTYGCEEAGKREAELRRACVQAGGSVIRSGDSSHHCIRHGGEPRISQSHRTE